VTDRGDLFAILKESLESGPSPLGGEQRTIAVTRRGEEHYYSVEAVPMTGPNAVAAGLLVVLHDVTWFKQVDRVKSEFVSTVSHEFRTPLTSIAMGVALLEENPAVQADSRAAEILKAVAEETHRLTHLVADLLDLTRMESGRLEMVMLPVDSAALMQQAVAAFKPQAEEKRVSLEVVLDGHEPTLMIDGDKVTWVLNNLMSNALRYTPAGGRITLTAERRGEVGLLRVSDTGTGIPPEAQSQVFDKFFQVPGRPGGGAGLGLAICKEIVHAHRGRIWVQSEPGLGSTFFLTVPLAST